MRSVILSKRAFTNLEKLINYLETDWSEKAKQDFIEKLDKSLDIIKKYPESTEKSDLKKGLHRCVVTKQTTLYYQFNSTTIKVITLFDTRMNPKRLKTRTK
jgi:plasmid stabilization system protein ParE